DIAEVSAFGVNYTLFLNIAAFGLIGILLWLRREGQKAEQHDHEHDHGGHHHGHEHDHDHDHGDGSVLSLKNVIVGTALTLLAGGLVLKAASLI
ncbi:MAG TPA: permease, partial [Thalassospira sp.]|nr:permease [Thalassospira sp.]